MLNIVKPLLTTDWHLHDSGSHDGSGTPLDYVVAAQKVGITSIAITNHVELYDPKEGRYDVVIPRDIDRLIKVKESIEFAKRKQPSFEILFGVELENNPLCYPQMEEILGSIKFDFVIGSVHIIDGVPISASGCKDFLRKNSPEFLFKAYFEEMAMFVEWGKFDILGHGDIIRRYLAEIHPTYKENYPKDILEPIFRTIKNRGQGLEINTSGLFQAPKDTYPSLEMVNLAVLSGITRFTLGSDAHKPTDIGRGYRELT